MRYANVGDAHACDMIFQPAYERTIDDRRFNTEWGNKIEAICKRNTFCTLLDVLVVFHNFLTRDDVSSLEWVEPNICTIISLSRYDDKIKNPLVYHLNY